MKLFLGADHAGFYLKEKMKKFLIKKKHRVIDCGNHKYNKNDDYPDYAYAVAKKIHRQNKGILFCGSAEGMSIAANKIKGTRAVVVKDLREARLTREHNNANILCLSGWHTTEAKAKNIITLWLQTPFSTAQRHHRRINKIQRIENKEMK